MGWSEPEVRCKNHPDLNQLQGVCASCLREKLADLYLPSENYRRARTTTTSPPPSSSSFGGSSTVRHHKRVGSEIMGSVRCSIVSVGNELKKSKSITTFVPRNSVGGDQGKKKGFWSKFLLHSRGNKEDVLMRSRTARARLY